MMALVCFCISSDKLVFLFKFCLVVFAYQSIEMSQYGGSEDWGWGGGVGAEEWMRFTSNTNQVTSLEGMNTICNEMKF